MSAPTPGREAETAATDTGNPLMLSVSGLRGLLGRSLTPEVAMRYGAVLGTWFTENRGAGSDAPPVHLVVGRDGRSGGEMLELAVTAGLMATGCHVTSLGIASTPAVGVMVDELAAEGGVVITASHNPIAWNGIKALTAPGLAPPARQAAAIVDRYRHYDRQPPAWAEPHAIGTRDEDASAAEVHVQRVLEIVDVDRIRNARLSAVVDSICGAGGGEAHALLDALGVKLVHMNPEPTGCFPHPPEPTAEHLEDLCRSVPGHAADVGFAQDPDADRLAIVDHQGRYIGEEYTLALAAWHLLEQHDEPASCILAANLSTSRMVDDIASRYGARVLRTAVGEANVVEAMRREGCILGGEGNGGVIFPQVGLIRDSLVAMAFTLELMATRGQPLAELLGQLPAYAMVKEKVEVQAGLTDRLAPLMQDLFPGERMDCQDGVRIDWPDRWIHVRPSNTEPIVRLIAEAADEANAKQLIEQTRAALARNHRSGT